MLTSVLRNQKQGLRLCTEAEKIRWLNSNVLCIAYSRWARWPYSIGLSKKIDAFQRSLIAMLLQIRPVAEEDAAAFVQRRHGITSRLAQSTGRWSLKGMKCREDWRAHVSREADVHVWSQHVVGYRNSLWLEAARALLGGSRTGTRARPGRPRTRWE